MRIVLTIFAILGVILLALLVFVLLLIAALLFAPFRYRIWGQKEDAVCADIRLHWLLHAVGVRIVYAKEGVQWTLRLFGIPIKRSKKKPPQEQAEKQTETEEELPQEKTEPDGLKEETPSGAKPKEEEEAPAKPEPSLIEEKEEEQAPKESFFVRIRKKIKELLDTVRCLYELFIRKKNLLRDYLKKKSVKEAVLAVWDVLKWLLLHIAPQKLSGWVAFGAKDPAVTGEVTALAGVLYPVYGEKFSFYPDFSSPGVRGEVLCTGRIRLIGIVVRSVRLYRDQNLRTVIKEAMAVKDQMLAAVPEMKQILGKA